MKSPYRFFAACACSAVTLLGGSEASLVFSFNDQTTTYRDGKLAVRSAPRPGSVTVVDLSAATARAWHVEGVPGSVIGPPACVVANAAGNDILVASGQQADPAQPGRMISDHRLTRLRFDGTTLSVVSQCEIGAQPAGMALSRDGRRAWVALRGAGQIALVELGERGMTLRRTQEFAPPRDLLSDVALSPDGRTLLASLQATDLLLVLDVADDGSLRERQRLPLPPGAYQIAFFHAGDRAVVGCTRGEVFVVVGSDNGAWRVEATIPAGRVPEGVAISPDGRWLAAACLDGANVVDRAEAWFGQPSRVYLYAVSADGAVTLTQTIALEGIPQSAVFTPDGRRLVIGQFGRGNLRLFEWSGREWQDTGAVIEVPGQVAALATVIP